MSVIVVTPPGATIVSVAEAKAHLRIDHDDDNDRIQGLLWAAQNEFDGPDGTLQRAVAVQQIELRLNTFPACDDIELPVPPLLIDDDHPLIVTYIDGNGVEQTVDPATYSIVTAGRAGVARIALGYDQAWPDARWQADAVKVRFWCGYKAGDTRAEGLKQAIKMHAEMNYDGQDAERARKAIAAALAAYRKF
jgi:uncharacterized phiE125 gp8 family phage protein